MHRKLEGKSVVRLLVLHPGYGRDGLYCTLLHFSLACRPKYEALSYEWSSLPGSGGINCNGHIMDVTENLYHALRYLRFPKLPRYLWIDAICINQRDRIEKASQVSMMKQIYASATETLVWLGPHIRLVGHTFEVLESLAYYYFECLANGMEDDTSLAFSLRTRLSRQSILQGRMDQTHTLSDLTTYTLPRRPELSDSELFQLDHQGVWSAIDSLFQATYFQRSWIIQEVAVSVAPRVIIGRRSLPWDIFRAAHRGRILFMFQDRDRQHASDSPPDGPLSCVEDARQRYRNPASATDLASALACFTYSRESSQRDHIYAALGLVKAGLRVAPDYSKPIEEVFLETATCIVRSRNDLYHIGNKSVFVKRRMLNIPSWVPEWTGETTEGATNDYSIDFARLIEGRPYIDGQSLHVNAWIVDEIALVLPFNDYEDAIASFGRIDDELLKIGKSLFARYVTDTSYDRTRHTHAESSKRPLTPEHDASHLIEILAHAGRRVPESLISLAKDGSFPVGNELLNIEALWSVMTHAPPIKPRSAACSFENLLLVMHYIMSLESASRSRISSLDCLPKHYGVWVGLACELLHTGQHLPTEIAENFGRYSLNIGEGEDCIFLSSSGFIGKAPKSSIRKGHVVAVLGGAYMPYILRRRSNSHVLMSHAYVEGITGLKTLPSSAQIDRIELR